MTREQVIKELEARGIKAQATETVKNGVVLQGIALGDGNVRPNIYADWYESVPESEIINFMEQIKETMEEQPQFDIDTLSKWEYAKEHLLLCIQQKGDEEICKRDFLDMEQYVRVIVDEERCATYKVRPDMLEKFGITEDVLFQTALNNLKRDYLIEDMIKMMADLSGMSIEEVIEMQGHEIPSVVVSNKYKAYGASVICLTEILQTVADTYERDLVVIPSSIHECILHPVEELTDFRYFDYIINDVNATQLAPEEVLSDHSYRFNREEGRITYYKRNLV